MNVRRASILCLVALAGCATVPLRSDQGGDGSALPRGPRPVEISSVSGLRLRPDMKSWKTLHQENVVIQQYDYSCGAAAVTTMLVHYFGERNMTEQQVLDAIFKRLKNSPNGEEAIADRIRNGLSMLDLQQTAAEMGYQSAVAQITLEQARKLEAPVIVRIIKNDFKHFVVLRGFVDGRVFLADSVRGNIRLSEEEFLKQWNYVALFLGKSGFGLPKDHPLAVRAQSSVQPELDAARRTVVTWPGLRP